jgi:hypothetical protein
MPRHGTVGLGDFTEAARAKFDTCGGPAALWDQAMALDREAKIRWQL